MVGVGLDPGGRRPAREPRVRRHHQVVPVLHRQALADFGEFGGQGVDAVALLDAQVGDPGEADGRGVEGGEHRQGRDRVLDLRALDHRRHAREHADQLPGAGVGLGEGRGGRAEIDLAAGQGLRGPEVGRRRGVGLDPEVAGGVAGRGDAPGPAVRQRRHLGPEPAHGRQRQVDIAAGAHLDPLQRHLDRAARAGGRHQQRRDVLAGQGGVDLDPAAVEPAATVDHDRRGAGERLRLHPQRRQGGHQRPDRALAHVLVAVEGRLAVHQGGRGGEEAHGGAGVSEEQRRLGTGQPSPALHHEAGGVGLLDPHPHGAQRLGHPAGVVALQRTAQAAGAAGEPGQQEGAVCDRLRARRSRPSDQGPPGRNDLDRAAHRGASRGGASRGQPARRPRSAATRASGWSSIR